MMHRRYKIFLAAAFVGALWLVGLQVVWPFLPIGAKLKGATEDPPRPQWNWNSVRHGEAFRAADTWYDGNVGLRNFWVRLDNQVSYSVFDEIPYHGTGTQVVAGAHDWLFERHYIRDSVTPGSMSEPDLREFARHIRSVQDKLARRGIPFLLVIGPNKAEVYPEHAPAAYFGGRRQEDVITDFERARPVFQAAGINFYDGPQRFDEWKRTGTRDLFARSGTHWSYDATFRVLQEIRERLNPGMRHPFPDLKLQTRLTNEPQMSDTDLLVLLNLLSARPHEHPLPYPTPVVQTQVPQAALPRILWVHDSFGFVLIDLLYAANAVQPSESLYYFKNCYHLPGSTPTNVRVEDIKWKEFIQPYDAVIMVWTEIAFQHKGWGFFESVDSQLN